MATNHLSYANPLLETRDTIKSKFSLAPKSLKIRVPFTIPIDLPRKHSRSNTRQIKMTRSLNEILDDANSIRSDINRFVKYYYDLDSNAHDILENDDVSNDVSHHHMKHNIFPDHFSLQQCAIVEPEIERLSINNPENENVTNSDTTQQLFSFGSSICFPNLTHTSTPIDEYALKKSDKAKYRKVIDLTMPMHVLGGERHQAVTVLSDDNDLRQKDAKEIAVLLESDTRAILPIRYPENDPDVPPLHFTQGTTRSYYDPKSRATNPQYPKDRLPLHGYAFSEKSMFPSQRPYLKLMKGTAIDGKLYKTENVLLHPDSYMYGLFTDRIVPPNQSAIEDFDDEAIDIDRYMKTTHQIRDVLMHVRSTSFDHAHMSFLLKDNDVNDPVVALRGILVMELVPIVPKFNDIDHRLIPYHNQVTFMENILSA